MSTMNTRLRTFLSAATVTVGIVLGGAVQASVFSSTPDLPPSSGEYVRTAGGTDCFASLGVCLVPGQPSGMIPISSTFDASGQNVQFSTLYTFTITDLNLVAFSAFSVLGTMTQQIIGRTGASDTGSWDTAITQLNLTGPIDVNTATIVLSSAPPSTGHAEVTPVSGGYEIENFFDVFAKLTRDGSDPVEVYLGSVHVELLAIPEPIPLAIMGLPLVAFGLMRRRT